MRTISNFSRLDVKHFPGTLESTLSGISFVPSVFLQVRVLKSFPSQRLARQHYCDSCIWQIMSEAG